jgi:hypothetical protein
VDGCYESRDEGEMSGRDGRFLGKMMHGPYIAATGALRERARGLGKRRLGARMWARRGWAEKEGRGKGRKMFSILYVCVYIGIDIYYIYVYFRSCSNDLNSIVFPSFERRHH